MADFVGVAIIDGLHDLCENRAGLVLGEVPLIDDPVEEFATEADLHHEVDVAVVFVGLEEFDDVGMVLKRF